ncbi:tetratricopeptide repeat protein [Aliikangiella marina]|nr:tetratricopeptide repeat protein [Aliikangiella marina]
MDKNNCVTSLIRQAIDFSGNGEYSKAINLLTQAILIEPDNEQAFFERGMAYLELNNEPDALADFDRALQINPEYSGARDWRSRTLSALGKYDAAADEKLRNLRKNPNGKYGMGVSPQSWADCATAFIAAGKHTKARELLEEYFLDYVTKVESYANYETAPMRILSKLLIQSGAFERASEYAKTAYHSQHQVPADILAYALALEASGDIDGAKKLSAEAMKINDQMPGAKQLYQRLSKY